MNEATINSILETAIKQPTAQAVKIATSKLLGESDLKVGQKVAIVDELTTVGGFVGAAKVKSIPNNDSGQVEIELPNGTVVFTQASLVVPI